MYFKFFKLQDWGKRSGEGRRRNCAVLPLQSRRKKYSHPLSRDESICFVVPPLFRGLHPPLFRTFRRRMLRRFRRSTPYTQTRRMSFTRCTAETLQPNGLLSARYKRGTASASRSPRRKRRSFFILISHSFSSGSSYASQDRRAASPESASPPRQGLLRTGHYMCRTGEASASDADPPTGRCRWGRRT